MHAEVACFWTGLATENAATIPCFDVRLLHINVTRTWPSLTDRQVKRRQSCSSQLWQVVCSTLQHFSRREMCLQHKRLVPGHQFELLAGSQRRLRGLRVPGLKLTEDYSNVFPSTLHDSRSCRSSGCSCNLITVYSHAKRRRLRCMLISKEARLILIPHNVDKSKRQKEENKLGGQRAS